MAILELRSDLSKNDRQQERERLLDEFHLGHLIDQRDGSVWR